MECTSPSAQQREEKFESGAQPPSLSLVNARNLFEAAGGALDKYQPDKSQGEHETYSRVQYSPALSASAQNAAGKFSGADVWQSPPVIRLYTALACWDGLFLSGSLASPLESEGVRSTAIQAAKLALFGANQSLLKPCKMCTFFGRLQFPVHNTALANVEGQVGSSVPQLVYEARGARDFCQNNLEVYIPKFREVMQHLRKKLRSQNPTACQRLQELWAEFGSEPGEACSQLGLFLCWPAFWLRLVRQIGKGLAPEIAVATTKTVKARIIAYVILWYLEQGAGTMPRQAKPSVPSSPEPLSSGHWLPSVPHPRPLPPLSVSSSPPQWSPSFPSPPPPPVPAQWSPSREAYAASDYSPESRLGAGLSALATAQPGFRQAWRLFGKRTAPLPGREAHGGGAPRTSGAPHVERQAGREDRGGGGPSQGGAPLVQTPPAPVALPPPAPRPAGLRPPGNRSSQVQSQAAQGLAAAPGSGAAGGGPLMYEKPPPETWELTGLAKDTEGSGQKPLARPGSRRPAVLQHGRLDPTPAKSAAAAGVNRPPPPRPARGPSLPPGWTVPAVGKGGRGPPRAHQARYSTPLLCHPCGLPSFTVHLE